jgi:formylglycine-generating enzyme
VGKPALCAAGLDVTETGCVARPRAVGIAAGLLRIGPSDWEAQGQITPLAVPMEAFAIDA